MTSIFAIRKNYTVKRDDPKIATKGKIPQILTALNDNKSYHLLLFHDEFFPGLPDPASALRHLFVPSL
jgi:hypothetical protein